MTAEEIKLRRLAGQHLLQQNHTQTVIRDLCGVQCQFLSHALHSLSIRCHEVSTENLVKSWTLRGTMHLFSADDLPLFLHEGRNHFLRPVDTLESDSYISAQRKDYFADLILDAVAQGTDTREALKALCESRGMTEQESQSLFDPWGGIIRALCESGKLCHKVQQKKAYALCPPFTPMEELPARKEMLHRYFTYFGPATVKDAAYFFGTTQTNIKSWMSDLPLAETTPEDKPYFCIDSPSPSESMPECLFLAGFDQLMLGYEKTENPFLPREHLRDIFNLAGIVRPAILIHGTVAGWWNLKNGKLRVTCFTPADQNLIAETATQRWPDLKEIQFL